MEEPLSKKPRRGQRQRLEALNQNEANLEYSSLANYLEEQWSWGLMSGQTIQKIAMLALRDMEAVGCEIAPTSLQKLASIGTSGLHANNCHRDLMTFLPKKSKLPEAKIFTLNLQGGTSFQRMMRPHEVFHAIFTHYPENFLFLLCTWWARKTGGFLECI